MKNMIQPQHIQKKISEKHFPSLRGVWYRSVDYRYSKTPLQFSHTTIIPSRFGTAKAGTPAFPLLYFGENHDVVLKEVNALFNPPGSNLFIANPNTTPLILNVNISLSTIIDLTDEKVQKLLQLSFQELTGDWEGYRLRAIPNASVASNPAFAPTQLLGAELYKIPDLLGFLTISAKSPDRKNLVVFPDKIKTKKHGSIEFYDPNTKKFHHIP